MVGLDPSQQLGQPFLALWRRRLHIEQPWHSRRQAVLVLQPRHGLFRRHPAVSSANRSRRKSGSAQGRLGRDHAADEGGRPARTTRRQLQPLDRLTCRCTLRRQLRQRRTDEHSQPLVRRAGSNSRSRLRLLSNHFWLSQNIDLALEKSRYVPRRLVWMRPRPDLYSHRPGTSCLGRGTGSAECAALLLPRLERSQGVRCRLLECICGQRARSAQARPSVAVDRSQRYGSFTDSTGNTLDRADADVATGEDAWAAVSAGQAA